MKRFFTVCITLTCVFCFLCSSTVLSEEEERLINTDGFVYVIREDQTAEIVGYTGQGAELAVPSEIDGYPVVALGKSALASAPAERIILPESLKYLGTQALAYIYQLTEITIPQGVETLGYGVFWGCQNLKKVSIPDSVTTVEDAIAARCPLLEEILIPENSSLLEYADGVLYSKEDRRLLWYPCGRGGAEYVVPDGTRIIGCGAFTDTNLERIVFPASVESIGATAFWGSGNLKQINIPPKVTDLGDALSGMGMIESVDIDPGNTVFESDQGVVFRKEDHALIFYPAGRQDQTYEIPDNTQIIERNAFSQAKITEIKIPGSVKSIHSAAFDQCRQLERVTLNEGLEEIGYQIFRHCSALTSVSLPASVISIERNPFVNCSSLKEISVQGDGKRFTVINGSLIETQTGRLISYPPSYGAETYQIPEGVVEIGAHSFSGCTGLREVMIPEGVTAISFAAFIHAGNIQRISLPVSLEYIDLTAFENTVDGVSGHIPAQYCVKQGSYAEEYCKALQLDIVYDE